MGALLCAASCADVPVDGAESSGGSQPAAARVPAGWMRATPAGDPFARAASSRVLLRLTAADVATAERLYGPPSAAGALSGWWLRPLAPMDCGVWLLLSVSGAMYGAVGPPQATADADARPMRRGALAWRALITDVADER